MSRRALALERLDLPGGRRSRTFLVSGMAIVALVAGALVIHTAHRYVVTPLGHEIWEIVDTVLILALLIGVSFFVLHFQKEFEHWARFRPAEELAEARGKPEAKVKGRALQRKRYGLTGRELTVLRLVTFGRSDGEIAASLGISSRTASKHMEHILTKMGASSRTEAGVRAVREQLLG